MGESKPPAPAEPNRSEREEPAPVEAAIDAAARAAVSLVELKKTIAELSSGLSGASAANVQLERELLVLRVLLEDATREGPELAGRVADLERERAYLLDQQDEFLAGLLEDHAATVGELELQRDELRAEASRLRASLGVRRSSTNPPPPVPVPRPPSFRAPPALRLDDGELDTTLRGAWTPAPPALDAVVTRSPWPVSAASLPPEASPVLPLLKRKPDPTTRPLIDYSLGEGGVESELLEGAKLRSSKPPRK